MTIKEYYDAVGGNYDEAKVRFKDDTRIQRFVAMFVQEPTLSQLIDAVESKNWEVAFRMAHTLKGTAANMSFTDLQQKAIALTEALRPGVPLNDYSLFIDVKSAYELVIDTAKQLF